jgi:endoglucanase
VLHVSARGDRARAARRTCGLLAAAAAILLVHVPLAAAQSQPRFQGEVSVSGPELLRDGAPWMPRGIQIVGLVAPDDALSGKYELAHAQYGVDELRRAVADDADTVRFQVSQFGLDPADPLYSAGYVAEVRDAVESARALGLTVIVSIQAEAPAGRTGRCPLPDAGTERVWNELAPMFAGDSGVLFELYNEPALPATAAAWQTWLLGGPILQGTGVYCQAVGMQTLIDDIRADGADNVIVVPGLKSEQTLGGMPTVSDPANPLDPQLVYGIHYPSLSGGITVWDRQFGHVAARAPVIVTEWQANSMTNCNPKAPTVVPLLLDYLASKQIGVVGFAFDLPGTIIADYSYTPTSYADFVCGLPGGGPGDLLFSEYNALAQAGGPSQSRTPDAWILSYALLSRLTAGAPTLSRALFDSPRTYVTGASASSLAALGLPAAVPAAQFASETALATAIRRHTLRRGTEAVIYVPAHSSRTPVDQQRRLALYYRRGAELAHRHGLLFVAGANTDLVSALAPLTPSSRWDSEFLKLRLAADGARYADAYAVQAPGAGVSPAKYASFVRAAAAQASKVHSDVELIGGISTAAQPYLVGLLDDAFAIRPPVTGYWLQAAAGRRSRLAITFLRQLNALNG